jgi:hypothetical protein
VSVRYLYDVDSPWVPIEAKGGSYVIPQSSLNSLRQILQRIPGTPASTMRPTMSTGGAVENSTGSTTPTTATKPVTHPAESAAERTRLLQSLKLAKTRTALVKWREREDVQTSIEKLTEKDGAMFAAEFKKRWEALPESLAMAG